MMSTRRLRFCGTVSTRGAASTHLKSAGDAVLIERGRPRLLVLSCPCGCGEEFPINLDPRRFRLAALREQSHWYKCLSVCLAGKRLQESLHHLARQDTAVWSE